MSKARHPDITNLIDTPIQIQPGGMERVDLGLYCATDAVPQFTRATTSLT